MNPGPLGRLGSWSHGHRRMVIASWAVLAIALGAFAPRLESALSGAMWEVRASDSLEARQVIEREFGGLSSQSAAVVLTSPTLTLDSPEFQARVAAVGAVLAAEPAFGPALPAQPSPDGRTVLVQAGSLVDPTEAVRAAERVSDEIGALSDNQIQVSLTGSPAFWADFNEVNRKGMFKAELITWPITAIILVIAFGSLAAAGLPLLLTAVGLVSAMGVLFGLTQALDLSIWTLNFAMMFALALGIDYALFIVTRFRAAHHAAPADVPGAIAVSMDTSGKAVLFSGLTVIISIAAVLLVPVPAFQSIAAGMMLSVAFVLLAALTLLPAVLGPGVNRFSMPWNSMGDHRSAAWERFVGIVQRRKAAFAIGVTALLLLLAAPVARLETGMPGINVLPEGKQARAGYDAIQAAMGPGGPGPIQVVVPVGTDPAGVAAAIAGA